MRNQKKLVNIMSDQMGLLFFKIVVLNVAILYRSAKITHMELRKPPNTGRLAFCFNAKYRCCTERRYLGEIRCKKFR